MGLWFTTIHHGEADKLGLASELERFANDQWIGAQGSQFGTIGILAEQSDTTFQCNLNWAYTAAALKGGFKVS